MASERQKMLVGELYGPFDPELVAARALARDLCQDLCVWSATGSLLVG
jgi:maltose O-acetyltransferase